MSTERKIFITALWVCLVVLIEAFYSAARYFFIAENDGAAALALIRALIAWWIGSSIAATLKDNPEK